MPVSLERKTDPAAIKQAIAAFARELGFDAVGFAPATLPKKAGEELKSYLSFGYHGEMNWLASRSTERASPHALWPEARSVVVLGMNYAFEGDPLATLGEPQVGNVSVYARGADYHDVLKRAVKRLAAYVVERHGGEVKVFVDTAPVMEKPIGERGGLGWQGKHTNLVSKEFGSWLFLAELFTTLELPADEPFKDHCGRCQRCLEVCPTDAFPKPYRLDARRCISYLTIEHKGHIAPEFRAAIGNRIYGCDDCLAVCPWNKFAKTSREMRFSARPGANAAPLEALAALDDAGFRRRFAGSPIKRIGRDRFVRNVLIAIGNSDVPALARAAEDRLNDVSPLVRGMAVWALACLVPRERFAAHRDRCLPSEKDDSVRREWEAPFRTTAS